MPRSIALLSGLLLAACSSDPASIRVAPTQVVTGSQFISLGAAALDESGKALDVPVMAVKVSDPALLKLGNNGELQCQGYGDVTVSLTAGPAAGPATGETLIRCQLVKEIRVQPEKLAFSLKPDTDGVIHPSSSDPLQITVIGADGQPVANADLAISSADPTIARIESGNIVQVRQRGATTIKLAAGDKLVEIPVSVSLVALERVGLEVPDGETHGIPLEAGHYSLTIGATQPVEVEVQGADCEGQGEATAHTLACELKAAGTLRIENPALLGFGGGPASVSVRVLQLP